MGEKTRAVSLREQALEAIKAWEALYEREKQRAEQLQQQAEIHAQEARTANATIHEIYQACTGATGEPGNWHGAEPVRRIVNELREAKQTLRDVRPEIDSLIKGLHHSHVNPSDGLVHDESVHDEITQLEDLRERIDRLVGKTRPETEDDKNRRYAGMLERVRTAPSAMDESIDDVLDEALGYVHEGRGDAVRDELRRLRNVERACEGEAYLHRKYYERAAQLENELSDTKKQVTDAEDRERELIAELGRLSSLPEKMRMEACSRNLGRDTKKLIFGFSGEIDRALAARKGGIDKLLDEMSADIDSMSDEEIRAEAAEDGITGEGVRRVIESATAEPDRYRAPANLDGLKVPPSVRKRLLGRSDLPLREGAMRAAQGHDSPHPEDDAPHTSEQAHGDALAALNRIALIVYDEESPEPTFVGDMADEEFDIIRRHLTASGVPEGWKWQTERDVTDEYITSLIAPDGTTVYVGDDEKAVAWLKSLLSANSGVPYVPESVVDEIVDEFEWMAEDEDGGDASHTPADWERLMLKDFAMLLLSEAPNRTGAALASAPAVRDWLTLLEREDLGLVPISVPTGGDDFDVQWTVVSYHMAEPKERVIGRGPTPRDALSDAAPF